MNKLLVCPKQSGNTFTVCDYVSKHADIDLKFINKKEIFRLDGYKTIILCSGVYVDKPHANLTKWLENLTMNQIDKNTKFYMFMTWFGRGKSDKIAFEKINLDLKKIDAKLEDNYSTCFGQRMGIIRSGHPNNDDLKKF